MSLITCPDCGHKVSDLAVSCPECGRPVATMPKSTPSEIRLPKGLKTELQGGEEILVSDGPTRSTRRATSRPRRFPWVSLFLVIVIALLVSGVALFRMNRHSQERTYRAAAASKAIETVGKIRASLDVGINFQSYSARLQDAAAAVSLYEPEDEIGTTIKQSLEKAVRYYKAGNDAWNADIQSSWGIKSRAWYWLRDYPELELGVSSEGEDVDAEHVRQAAWVVAGEAYEKARQTATAYAH